MKKSILVATAVFASTLVLTGCLSRLTYMEQERPLDQVEEMIENQLELENPSLDLNVKISKDSD